MVELLRSPWNARFEDVINSATKSLVLCSPYVGHGPCDRVRRSINDKSSEPFQLTLLTDLSRDNMLSGATDPGAIARLVQSVRGACVRFLPSLHAKVYIADEKLAVVTSANLTDGGLFRNLEYGALFSDAVTVQAIRDDVLQFSSLGSPIDEDQLLSFAMVVEELREMRSVAERQARSRIRREFDRRLREVDDEVLRARTAGRTDHAIFADTIQFLLRHGPMKTIELHAAIKRIHPDLCDDTVDRVIDGRHFGKKWKHGVRTAQVFLRRRGDIRLKDGRWRLIENG
ncbi:MAG: phospholipase D family protein [Phycisphaerales bacterium]|nr:phospholipase D family protein [Phycisphaerales bacterium]